MSKNIRLLCPEHSNELQSHKLTPAERASIKPGVFVKINDNQEGFWTKVSWISGDTICGIVDNDLQRLHDFKRGDSLEFTVDSVYQVYKGK